MFSERVISTTLGFLNKSYLTTEDRWLTVDPVAPSRATVTCSTPTCRSASACARTARSTASSTRRTAHASYFGHLREEMRLVADLGYDFASLYVGGGTPTILLDELAETIDLARELFPSIAEVSAETSPNHLGPRTRRDSRPAASSGCRAASRASTTASCARWTATASTAPARRSSSASRRWPARSPRSTWT